MYVSAGGGHVGAGAANAHIRLISALGACGSLPTSIVVNELTSAAAAYALSGFASAGTTAPSFQGNSPGLNQAFVTLTNLINPASGTFATTGRESNTAVIKQRLYTVADALAACNVSSGAAVCAELFSCAQANATYASTGQPCTGGTGPVTTDTMNAALAIAQNAGLVSMSGVWDVATASGTPFVGALSSAPLDWTLPLIFTVRNYGPLAIDAGGHVWLLAPDPNPASPPPAIPNLAVTEIDADGTFLSPHKTGHDWSGGGVANIQGNDVTNLAIDQSGNVWISGTGPTIAELSSSGAGAPGAPWNAGNGPDDTAAVTIDSSGNAWFASGGTAPTVFEISGGGTSPVGTNISGTTGYSTLNCPCNGMSADAFDNVWTVSSGTSQFLAQMDSTGHEGNIVAPPAVGGMAGLSHFTAIATDASGHLWITDQHYHGVWEFTPSGAGGTYSATPFNNAAAPGTIAKGIAVDGAGHKWVANNPSSIYPSITELSADGTVNLSPSNGFGFLINAGVITAYGIAIDGSGNVWVSDGNVNVTEYVGAAAPTKNPISSAIRAGSFVP